MDLGGVCPRLGRRRPGRGTERGHGARSFTLSSDPSVEVLRYCVSGGMRPGVAYTLYGNGRPRRARSHRYNAVGDWLVDTL